MGFEQEIHTIWRDRVDSRYLFRGMSARDLADPLDPTYDPLSEIRPKLFRLMNSLQDLVDAGFRFRLKEEHFGKVCRHDLQDILNWTWGDLHQGGIDFTSQYAAAQEYSDCFQGSQLKQNFKTITDELPQCREHPVLRERMTDEGWRLLSDVGSWVSRASAKHRSIVLWVRRSCPEFGGGERLLPVGPSDAFLARARQVLKANGLDNTSESLISLLPDEKMGFDYRLRVPLSLSRVERIEEVDPEVP